MALIQRLGALVLLVMCIVWAYATGDFGKELDLTRDTIAESMPVKESVGDVIEATQQLGLTSAHPEDTINTEKLAISSEVVLAKQAYSTDQYSVPVDQFLEPHNVSSGQDQAKRIGVFIDPSTLQDGLTSLPRHIGRPLNPFELNDGGSETKHIGDLVQPIDYP